MPFHLNGYSNHLWVILMHVQAANDREVPLENLGCSIDFLLMLQFLTNLCCQADSDQKPFSVVLNNSNVDLCNFPDLV